MGTTRRIITTSIIGAALATGPSQPRPRHPSAASSARSPTSARRRPVSPASATAHALDGSEQGGRPSQGHRDTVQASTSADCPGGHLGHRLGRPERGQRLPWDPEDGDSYEAPTDSNYLDCSDFGTRDAAALVDAEQHNLDADGDGVACERLWNGYPLMFGAALSFSVGVLAHRRRRRAAIQWKPDTLREGASLVVWSIALCLPLYGVLLYLQRLPPIAYLIAGAAVPLGLLKYRDKQWEQRWEDHAGRSHEGAT